MSELKIHSDKAWEIASHFSDVLASDTRTLAAMIDIALAEATTPLQPQKQPEAELLRNLRDSYEAMCAMRDAINEHIPMPSLESDLLQGPETSVFCATVAEAVILAVRDRPPPPSTHAAPDEDVVEAVARRIYEDAYKGMSNIWAWNDRGLDDEHPGARERYLGYARSAIAATAQAPEKHKILTGLQEAIDYAKADVGGGAPAPEKHVVGIIFPLPSHQEQAAFEDWATESRYEMHQHPLHYLFVDKQTNAARQGWKAALAFVRKLSEGSK